MKLCGRCATPVRRCTHGRCWCAGFHHTSDGLALCPDGRHAAHVPDLSDIGPSREAWRELAESYGLDPWKAGAA